MSEPMTPPEAEAESTTRSEMRTLRLAADLAHTLDVVSAEIWGALGVSEEHAELLDTGDLVEEVLHRIKLAESAGWERDVALSRVAAAEAVGVRMALSLPDSGPVESWSERDRAVRDYEGDLSTALAVETDTVGERLREVERERDEARQERDGKVVELTITRAVLAQQTRKRDEARAEVAQLRVNYQDAIDEGIRRGGQIAELQEALYKRRVETARMRPVVAAAAAWDESWVLGEADVVKHTTLHNFVAAYRAALSAPVEADAVLGNEHADDEHVRDHADGSNPIEADATEPATECTAYEALQAASDGIAELVEQKCAAWRYDHPDGERYVQVEAVVDMVTSYLIGLSWEAGAPDEPAGDTAPAVPCRDAEGMTGIDCMVGPAGHPLPHRGWWCHKDDAAGETAVYIEWPAPDCPDFTRPALSGPVPSQPAPTDTQEQP